MIKTPEVDIIDRILEAIRLLSDPLIGAKWCIVDGTDEYQYLVDGCPEANGDVTHITDSMDDAHRQYTLALECIIQFDNRLAKLIALRGKFAEETGIPMFSHIGEQGKRLELEEYIL